MWIREEFGRWFTGKRKSGEGKFPCAASRLRSGSLRSPPLRHEAAHPPQGVTHAVITKCYLCDAQIPSLAPPVLSIFEGCFVDGDRLEPPTGQTGLRRKTLAATMSSRLPSWNRRR